MSPTYTKSDSEINVQVGDHFVVELEGNPTTGYDWQLTFDPDKLSLLNQLYKPKGGGIGAGGVQVSEFKAVETGQTTLRAIYKRSWEPAGIEDLTFNVKIKK